MRGHLRSTLSSLLVAAAGASLAACSSGGGFNLAAQGSATPAAEGTIGAGDSATQDGGSTGGGSGSGGQTGGGGGGSGGGAGGGGGTGGGGGSGGGGLTGSSTTVSQVLDTTGDLAGGVLHAAGSTVLIVPENNAAGGLLAQTGTALQTTGSAVQANGLGALPGVGPTVAGAVSATQSLATVDVGNTVVIGGGSGAIGVGVGATSPAQGTLAAVNLASGGQPLTATLGQTQIVPIATGSPAATPVTLVVGGTQLGGSSPLIAGNLGATNPVSGGLATVSIGPAPAASPGIVVTVPIVGPVTTGPITTLVPPLGKLGH